MREVDETNKRHWVTCLADEDKKTLKYFDSRAGQLSDFPLVEHYDGINYSYFSSSC